MTTSGILNVTRSDVAISFLWHPPLAFDALMFYHGLVR